MFTQEEKRNVKFRGLLVPGHKSIDKDKYLIEVESIINNGVLRNYEAYFTILDVKIIDKRWLSDLKNGLSYESQYAPKEWVKWIKEEEELIIMNKELINDEDTNIEKYMEIDLEKEFLEGNTIERVIKVKERNNRVRKVKLTTFKEEFGQAFCEICGENDEVVLEVHHENIKLSEMKEEHKTKLNELRVLCANCHRKVHGHKISVNYLINNK